MKIGIDLGGSHISIALINEANKIIIKKAKDFTKKDKENIAVILEGIIITIIEDLLNEKNIKNTEIEKIGFAVPGKVDENGNITAVNLNLVNYPLKQIIKKYYKVPIQIRNDGKCAAICEKEYGNLKGYEDCVFLCLGTGIGSAVFLQNKLLKPTNSEGFEIGHMVIKKDGIKCNCGKNGCFEKYASMNCLKNKINKEINIKEELSGEEYVKLLKKEKNNLSINNVLEEYINDLSIGIINIIDIFEPEIIVLSGSFIYFEEILLEKLKNKIKQQKHISDKMPVIKIAKMGDIAGIIGATM